MALQIIIMEIHWLGITNEVVEDRVEFLRGVFDHIEHYESKASFFENIESALNQNATFPVVAILSFRSTAAGLDICKSVKALDRNNRLSILLVVEKAEIEQREAFIISGANDILLEPFGSLELKSKLDGFQKAVEVRTIAEAELQQSENMAMTAMEINSDMGQIISFARNAIAQKDYQGLAQAIFGATKHIAPNIVVEMFGHIETHVYTSTVMDETIQHEINQLKSEKRIIVQGDVLQINQTNLILHFKGVDTQDANKLGRISDNVSTLAEIANKFVMTLNDEEQVNHIAQLRRNFLSVIGSELLSCVKAAQLFMGKLRNLPEGYTIDTPFLESVTISHKKANKTSNIVNMLVDISLVNSVAEKQQPTIDISTPLNSIVKKYAKISQKKNIILKLGDVQSYSYKINEHYLTSVLSNLLESILQRSDNIQIEIGLNIIHTEDGNIITFTLSDNGTPMPIRDRNILLAQDIESLSDENTNKIDLKLLYPRLFAQYLGCEIEVRSLPSQWNVLSISFLDNQTPVEVVSQETESDVELF